MVPVIMASLWGVRTCLCWDGKGTEQGTAPAAVYVSRGKDGLPCTGGVATGEDGELIALPLLSFGRIS